jgi:hypothetical protein
MLQDMCVTTGNAAREKKKTGRERTTENKKLKARWQKLGTYIYR